MARQCIEDARLFHHSYDNVHGVTHSIQLNAFLVQMDFLDQPRTLCF